MRLSRFLRRRRKVLVYQGVSLLDYLSTNVFYNYKGIPTRECVCGCDLILIPVTFDEWNEISGYVDTGFCAMCGAMLTVVTPLDEVVL